MNNAVLDTVCLNVAETECACFGGGVGVDSGGKTKPYIKGHVTDGSSTFTFKINNSTDITVPVDSNGNWKWVVDRKITSLYKAFQNITNIDSLTIVYKKDTITNLNMIFQGCSVENLDISKLNTSKVTNWEQAFNNMPNCNYLFTVNLITESATNLYQTFLCHGITNKQKTLDLRNIETKNVTGNGTFLGISRQVWANNVLETLHLGIFAAYSKHSACTVLVSQAGYPNLANVTAEAIAIDMDFKATAKLTEQSVINIINAAVANVTYTLHSTVYNKCASGGEWNADVQAAIDAKALEGYTVTLISA